MEFPLHSVGNILYALSDF